MDVSRYFDQLQKNARKGIDYDIVHRHGDSGVLLMAPHGGGIEPGTGDIADASAGRRHSFYCFRGLKNHGNRALHIPSHQFDEPLAMTMTQEADWVLTVHGCRDVEPVVWVGGRDLQQGDHIIKTLQNSRIAARRCNRPGLCGLDPDNLCNRGRRRAGVQLEISHGLRKRLFTDLRQGRIQGRTPLFHRLTESLASCIQK